MICTGGVPLTTEEHQCRGTHIVVATRGKLKHAVSERAFSLSVSELPFNSVKVCSENARELGPEDFSRQLGAALQGWTDDRRNAVWVQFEGAEDMELAAVAMRHGFELHHARESTLMMCKWLADDWGGVENKIPPFATHQVGCAGWVVNESDEILLVQERGSFEKWKLPGGLAAAGEHFGEAASREVFEECGIKTATCTCIYLYTQACPG